MENNTLNQNASADCGGKDAKTASFLRENEFQKEVDARNDRLRDRNIDDRSAITLRSAARAGRG